MGVVIVVLAKKIATKNVSKITLFCVKWDEKPELTSSQSITGFDRQSCQFFLFILQLQL